MSSRTCIAGEEKSMPGLKASKDRLTLLLVPNLAADFNLRLMLIYPIKNPSALKNYAKSTLPTLNGSVLQWKRNYRCSGNRELESELESEDMTELL
ncbi:hypothetical protein QTO34_003947 [Cnephaeus nilssonii]|uniref:Uncharacterized protein n=1 Tax=Cnephaeus nilssonii TaxID=3371016 RepID=A0AA40HRQ9_CNENI|nr:hypothetical protein QTO34_003947 [Eptesicus nilssonii]